MEFTSLIQACLKKTTSVKLTDVSIRSEHKSDAFKIALSHGEISQTNDGSFQIKAGISKDEAETVWRSQERVRKDNHKRIDRKDTLHVKGRTSNGGTVLARIFWARLSTTHNASGTTCELSAKLTELEFSRPHDAEGAPHNTYLIYAIHDRLHPCDIRANVPERFSSILKNDWARNNSHKLRGEHDVCTFRDSTHQIIAAKTNSREEANELRINTDACFSFLLGQINESVGLLYIEDDKETFAPLAPASHAIVYPQPIKFPGQHYEPSCAAFWPAFAKLQQSLRSLNLEAAKDLRRAINKPLQLPADSSIELRLMLLSISIEALAMAILTQDRENYEPPVGIKEVIQSISESGAADETINRAKSMIGKMAKPAPTNVLKEFGRRMKLEKSQIGRWEQVRGKLVHGKGLDYDNIDEVMSDYDIILMLHHSIILSSVGYIGPIANHLMLGDKDNLLLNLEGVSVSNMDPLKELEVLYYDKISHGQFIPKTT